MILDYNKFGKLKRETKNGNSFKNVLYMMEQNPKRIVSHDISDYLFKHEYFGSYNRPFLQETKLDLNLSLIKHLYGKFLASYNESHRGQILKHLAKKVTNLRSLKDLLRYNGFNLKAFKGDPSNINPGLGISARFDILSEFNKEKKLTGGIDLKMTDFELSKQQTSIAVSGPTTENNKLLPEFNWNQPSFKNLSHNGLPKRFRFPYLVMSPKYLKHKTNGKEDEYEFEGKSYFKRFKKK